MTPMGLVEALAVELERATAHFEHLAEQQEPKRVSVYRQMIPREEFETDSFYPLVVIELQSVEDTAEGSLASVLLTIGSYMGARRGDFWREHLNLCEAIREYLLAHRVIGGRFLLQLPTYWGIAEPQSESFMYSNMFCQFFVAQPIPSVPYQQFELRRKPEHAPRGDF